MAEWKKIKAEYIRGGTSYRKLAQKYGVSFSTLRCVAAREKWTDLKSKTQDKLDTKLTESVAKKESERSNMFQDIADKLLRMISQGIDDGTIQVTGRGYRDITGALKDLKEIKGVKTDLELRETIARIENLERTAKAEENSASVTVTIEGGDAEWSK